MKTHWLYGRGPDKAIDTVPWKDVPAEKAKAYEEALARVLSKLWAGLPTRPLKKLFRRLERTNWLVHGPGDHPGRTAIRIRKRASRIGVCVDYLDEPGTWVLEYIFVHELAHLLSEEDHGHPQFESTLAIFVSCLCREPRRGPRRFGLEPVNPDDTQRTLQQKTK
jgi:hypothetical protein